MRLGRQVVHLVWRDLHQERGQSGPIGEIGVVQEQSVLGLVRVVIEVIDSLGIEGGRAANEAVNLIPLG